MEQPIGPSPAGAGARIVDRGYQRYTGVRLGVAHNVAVMVGAGIRRGLGLRRPAHAKLLPWLFISITYMMVIVVLAVVLLTGGAVAGDGPMYPRLFGIATLFFILFAGLAAPDLLCADRRQRVLSLYFTAPLRRLHYVGAQVIALVGLLLLVTFGPWLLLFVGNTLLAPSAWEYLTHHSIDLWHLIVGGLLAALYYGALALMIAAFSDRRPYASGIFLGLMLISTIVSNVISQAMVFNGHEWFALLDLANLPAQVMNWLFGARIAAPLTGGYYLLVTLGVTAASLCVLAWRYLRGED
ncbi:MAG TPA: hypothetical protein VIC27_04485 [Ktedonobacterales bacterium]